VIISRHVVFDESVFPFAATPSGTPSLIFLLQDPSSTVAVAPSLGVEQPPSSSAAALSSAALQPFLDDDPAIIMASLAVQHT
jgi:hypothetical protein